MTPQVSILSNGREEGRSRAKEGLKKIKKRSRRERKRNVLSQCAVEPYNYEKGKVVQARKSFIRALWRNY